MTLTTDLNNLKLTEAEAQHIYLLRRRAKAREEVVTIAELLATTLAIALPTLDDPTLTADLNLIVDRIKKFSASYTKESI